MSTNYRQEQNLYCGASHKIWRNRLAQRLNSMTVDDPLYSKVEATVRWLADQLRFQEKVNQ